MMALSNPSIRRVSTQQHQNIAFGQKKPKAATTAEQGRLAKAINHLNQSRVVSTETDMVYHMTEAFRIIRSIVRERTL